MTVRIMANTPEVKFAVAVETARWAVCRGVLSVRLDKKKKPWPVAGATDQG